jgi:hypothetical protein
MKLTVVIIELKKMAQAALWFTALSRPAQVEKNIEPPVPG